MATKVYKPEYPGLYYFDTFTFTTLGASGNRGPDSTKAYANAPWNPDQFSIVDGQQQWTVPATGTYNIVAAGAYGATPGRIVSGDVDLSEGQVLTMIVGQMPTPLVANVADNVTVGGGGGTFIVSDGKPLIVASGGDGGSYSAGYLSRDISVPNIVQPYISISGDGTRFVSLDFDIITNLPQLSIYKYVSSQWNLETSFSPIGFDVKMSGDGKTIVNTGSPYIYVYRYTTQWDLETILQNPNSVGYVDLSYDGSKLVSVNNLGVEASGYVFYRTGQTWSAPVLFSSGGWSNEAGVAISGDGNTLCMCSSGSNPPAIYDGSGVLSGYLPSYGTNECPTTITTSYDGSVIAAYTTPLHAPNATGFVRVFVNRVLSYQITFEAADYSSKYIQLSYDGTKLLLGDDSYVRLYTGDTAYTTISTDVSPIDIIATSMNSDASVVINAVVSLSAPTTTAYYKGTGSVPGSFIPSGIGNGVSGAGFYSDGQETDPFFGFFKPKAYVNGGFGNSYEYGRPGIPKEGGFGGGQSPLNLLTGLTNITGYKQVRPSIPLLSGQTVGSMALSEDGNTLLVSYIPYDHVGEGVNVYSYVDSSWVSSQLYNNTTWKPSVSISVDGSVWLIGSNVWRNGSFETQLTSQEQIYSSNYYPQQIRKSSVSGNGNVCIIFTQTSAWNIYMYSSGTWSLSSSFQTPGIRTKNDCALSFDGHTFVVMNQYTTSINTTEVKLYRYVNEIWTEELIYSITSETAITNTVTMNRDGSIIFFNTLYNGYKYSDGTLTSVPPDVVATAVFSRTNSNLYAYANSNKVYAPLISLDVTVNINPNNFLLSLGSNILAVCDSVQTGNKAIVFVDMYDPTTTCTAATSIDHGYPYDYEVQITGTSSFNGTWLITAGSSNTFTFQAFGGPTETSGYVSGTVTGISGGGGYTGSAGDGVSGATCYADESVVNFTDLGAISNTAGYVTVTLVDPAPITLSYDDTIVDNKIYISPGGVSYWYDVVYSSELKRFVTCSSFYNGQGIAYSSDGKQWYRSDYNGPGPLCLGWSSELGLFVVGTSAYVNNQISNNGINWVSVDSQHRFRSLLWVSFLHKFIGIEQYQNFLESSDGINWEIVYSSPYVDYLYNYSPSFISASSSNVIVCVNSTVYISNDGINWNTSLTTTGATCTSTYGKGIFFIVTDMFYYYYSADEGQTWSNGILPYTPFPYTPYISAVFTDSSIVVTGVRETFVSQDYSTWTRYPNNGMNSQSDGYHASVYNSIDQYIVSVSNREISLSLDGSIWTPADTTFIGALYDNVAYSPETSTVVAVASNGQTSTETGVYTKDGVIWKRIPGLNYFPKQCIWNPLQGLFFLGDYCFDPVSEILVQTSYREWIETTSPRGLLQSYYQQGLNNNLPIGKAFSLSGIIVDTGANVSSGDRVSCSGDTFIKMARYPNGTVYTSTDGINWQSYQLQGDAPSECNRIIYISKYKAFFVLSDQAGLVHKSYNGVEWSVVYQSPGIYLSEMVWCPTFNSILIFSIANNLTQLTFSN